MSLTQRVKLAQELHDGIAQDLVGLGYAIDSIIATHIDDSNRGDLRALRFDVTTLIEKLRLEIFELRGSELSEPQLNSADSMRADLDRIFNEVMSNAIQHSQGSAIEISISDNGIGGLAQRQDHFGLQGLIERAAAIGAELHLESDFSGTRVRISLPVASQ